MRRVLVLVLSTLLVAALAVPATAAGRASREDHEKRVINGTDAADGDFPSIVAMYVDVDGGPGTVYSFVCGGTLVHAEWVLTAAHCVSRGVGQGTQPHPDLYPGEEPSDWVMVIGREDLTDTTDGEAIAVDEIVVHPLYGGDVANEEDVALMHLGTPASSPLQALVGSDDSALAPVGSDAVVAGWGDTDNTDNYPTTLQFVDVAVRAANTCTTNTTLILCAGDDPEGDELFGDDSCEGDSGGPLTVDDGGTPVQVGIVSYGPTVCGTSPGGYSRVATHAAWIDGVTTSATPKLVSTTAPATVVEGASLQVTLRVDQPSTGTEVVTVTVDAVGTAAAQVVTPVVRDVPLTAGTTTTVALPTIADDVHEADVELTVTVTSTDVDVLDGTATTTVLDDDPLTVDVADVEVEEGDEGTSTVAVVMALDGEAAGGESVRVHAAGPGVALDRVVILPVGATEAVVRASIDGDTDVEDDQVLPLVLTELDDLVAGDVGTITVRDDDVPDDIEGRGDVEDVVVERVAGGDRVATALAASADRPDGGSDVVYLASSTSFPDALVATPLAHQDDAALLLTGPDALDERVDAELRRLLGPEGRVVLLGGTAALAVAVENAVRDADLTPDRIAGGDRFETATLVADRLDTVDRVLLATGRNFPDALSAGTAAAAIGGAILLTDDRVLPARTAAWLAGSDAPVTAVGGAAAAAAPTADPLVGGDRHATAVAVAERFLPSTDVVGLASGASFPDALAGGVLVAAAGGALLLTAPDELPAVTADHLRTLAPTRVIVLGGPVAVSDDVRDAVLRLLSAV